MKLAKWFFFVLIIFLSGCGSVNFRFPPQKCYPDFKMTVNLFNLEPQYQKDINKQDSIQIIHQSGYLYIKNENSDYCLGQYFIKSCDEDNQMITLMDYKTAVRIDVKNHLAKPVYTSWQMNKNDNYINCIITCSYDSTFVEKTSGRIEFMKRNENFKYKPLKYCPKRKY